MPDFFQRLNRELVRVGIWGRAARTLEEELRDHYLIEKAALLRQGKSEEEAEPLALSKLGSPAELAQKARLESDRHDGSLKMQFFLRFVPLCLGPLSFFTTINAIWLAIKSIQPPAGWHPPVLHHHAIPYPGVANFLGAAILFYYLGPWLAAYLWILRASYSPLHSWRYLLLLSGYLTLSYYVCASRILMTSDGVNLYFAPSHANSLLLVASVLLLITPWRVRSRMIRQPEIR
jgi:hypothetical protein